MATFGQHQITKSMFHEDNKTQERNLERLDYPESEDIYSQEQHIPQDGDGIPVTDEVSNYEITNGLDIPGAELDDRQKIVGSEDEENNYWSLGGDNHADLETPEDIN